MTRTKKQPIWGYPSRHSEASEITKRKELPEEKYEEINTSNFGDNHEKRHPDPS
tara:strand:+ start:2504 stop:2665 length:162 start_codon:yes stop_codon:yes gene_type:complete